MKSEPPSGPFLYWELQPCFGVKILLNHAFMLPIPSTGDIPMMYHDANETSLKNSMGYQELYKTRCIRPTTLFE